MNTPVSLEIEKLLIEKDIDMPVSPTIADVVMWLYRKHGIWVDVSTIKWNFDDNTIRFAYHITVYIDKSPSDNINSRFEYSSPIEAYEAAIEFSLKNLI
jgi:hypothetical protein